MPEDAIPATTDPPPRVVTLVLVSPEGELLGRLPPFTAATPWWQDAGPVVADARTRFGLDVTILRLLEAERPAAHGGAVTYLAEVDPAAVVAVGLTGLETWDGPLTEDPKRMPYARPGGPAADLAWADSILDALGRRRTGRADQIRTWNLSSLWRLPVGVGEAWLKVVPFFFEHEGALLEHLHGEAVPKVLGRDGGRMLLAGIAGEDRYDAVGHELHEMIEGLVDLQGRWLDRTDELRGLGMPDWSGWTLAREIRGLVERSGPLLDAAHQTTLTEFVEALPARLASITAAGIPRQPRPRGLPPGQLHGRAGSPGPPRLG